MQKWSFFDLAFTFTTAIAWLQTSNGFSPSLITPTTVRKNGHTETELFVSSLYSPPPSPAPIEPADNENDDDDKQSENFHAFWKKEQSQEAIRAHVQNCLYQVEPSASKSSIEVISAEPPLLVIHDFLSAPMCQDLIQAAKNSGKMQRSTTGAMQRKSLSRTSSTVWLNDEDCSGPLRLLAEKVSLISGLPPSHMENLQVCQYEPGERFNLHTDHQVSFNELDCRGRLATCLIYLAEPEEGGQTWFPDVLQKEGEADDKGREVYLPAKRGSAVFFWNSIEKPGQPNYTPLMDLSVDPRMAHAGLPVEQGEKWICNRWIHPINFDSGVVGLNGR
eukprot:CAMPEP_0198138244 /NCGR_PEP_ID=MMETSP1443-20131203/1667_1 /TAXON_ID=186043 /ORGANISM="Entomoneis sp., Strain CCMP2396" /LENGTH=332 /DNA_ID=CAMNT_0043799943 /DNA_START=85 /DNA_END=1083 /DNA_ORIENTATION=+